MSLRRGSIVTQARKSAVPSKPKVKKPRTKATISAGAAKKRSFRIEQSSSGLVIPVFDDDDEVVSERAFDEDEEDEEGFLLRQVTEETVMPEERGKQDDEFLAEEEAESEEDEQAGPKKSFYGDLKISAKRGREIENDEDDSDSDASHPWDLSTALSNAVVEEETYQTSLQAKINARLAPEASDDDDDDKEEKNSAEPSHSKKKSRNLDADSDGEDSDDSDDEKDAKKKEKSTKKEEEEEGKKKKQQFTFSERPDVQTATTFQDLNLSRGLLKAINRLGYDEPTPIQREAIPVALLGRDLCGSAVTGSGKTAAFMLPILERLQYRSRRSNVTRVIVLLPTRELAAQCFAMTQKLAKYTDVRIALIVGGLSVKKQADELRTCPDIVVATPGRLIDHVLNSSSLHLDDVEVLVLDEADRLLDLGFDDEVQQILKECPRHRQTMLFSATMTEAVDRLIKLSLDNPVRVAVDQKYRLSGRLTQEFIRVRPSRELEREAMLLALLEKTYKRRVIVFVRSKALAHRLCILCGLLKFKAAELHGNLSQTQRLESLDLFQNERVHILIATDLASRGLDIPGVDTVINMEMPTKHKAYVHRVGRTARAGNAGVACSFICEGDRSMFKEILKVEQQQKEGSGAAKTGGSSSSNVVNQSRTVPPEDITKWGKKIEEVEASIADIIDEERTERYLRLAEQERRRIENIIGHHQEIYSRPAKQWFQTETEKKLSKEKSRSVNTGSTNTPLLLREERKRERREKSQKKQEDPEEKALQVARRGLPGKLEGDELKQLRIERTKVKSMKRKMRREGQLRGVTPERAAVILAQSKAAKDGSLELKAKRNKLAREAAEKKSRDKPDKGRSQRKKPASVTSHAFKSKMKFKRR